MEVKFGKRQLENPMLPTKVPRAAWWRQLAAPGRLLFGSSNNDSEVKHQVMDKWRGTVSQAR